MTEAAAPSKTLSQDLWTGFKGRCPNCGKGKLFSSFLKVADHCNECGEIYSHHRADDLPAYIVILFTGHLFVIASLEVERHLSPPMWVHMVVWLPLLVMTTIGLLQPVKGAIVALQWRLGMHGFKEARQKRLEGASHET